MYNKTYLYITYLHQYHYSFLHTQVNLILSNSFNKYINIIRNILYLKSIINYFLAFIHIFASHF